MMSSSNLGKETFALLAFIATGSTFAHAKVIKSALEVNKKSRTRGQLRPISLAKHHENHSSRPSAAPKTLLAAENSQDAEQAWRTVRSYFGMEIFLEFDIGTPG